METGRLLLRTLEPYDVETFYRWENDTELWSTTMTVAPFSRGVIEDYIATYNPDLFQARQLRLIVERKADGVVVGAIDLYDFDPLNRRCMVGFLIDRNFRGNGYSSEALKEVASYCRQHIGMIQLGAIAAVENTVSRRVLQKVGFEEVGILKRWLKNGKGEFSDAVFCQLLF